MGVSPLFCCLKNLSPQITTIINLVANVIGFVFLIWGAVDIQFFRKGIKAVFFIGFVLVILCLIISALFLILLCLNKNPNYQSFVKIGKILCLVYLILCFLAFVFLLASFIGGLKDYHDNRDKFFLWINVGLSSKDWAEVAVPHVFALVCLIVMAVCANYLYKVFGDILLVPTNPIPVVQNTVSDNPAVTQPGLFPNNNGPVYPVNIQQSQNNLDNK